MSGPLTAVHRGVLMSVIAVFRVEIFFAHNEQENALNEAHNAGYACPAEEQIDNAPSNPAQIEFMYAKAAEKNGEECRSKFTSTVRRKVSEIAGKGRGRLSYAAFRAYFSFCVDQCSAGEAVFFIDAFCVHAGMEIILIGTIDIQLFKIPLRGQDAKIFT